MRISVVVPLFNKARTLERTLASIAAQSAGDFEVVVVDDGSTDGGPEIVEAWPDRRFRLIRQANGGPGSARNTGWKSTSAPIVAFLDADDEWEPSYLEAGLAWFRRAETAMVSQAWRDEPGSVYPEWSRQWSDGLWRAHPDCPLKEFVSRLAFCSPCSSMVRRRSLELYGGFYERNLCRYGEDAHLFLKILLNEEVAMDHNARARFHREDSALSGNYRQARPIEPFLVDPADIRSICPSPLRDLLERFFCTRAMKTATVLGYWGEGERARSLRQAFLHLKAKELPWYWTSLLATHAATTRVFGWLGKLHRKGKMR